MQSSPDARWFGAAQEIVQLMLGGDLQAKTGLADLLYVAKKNGLLFGVGLVLADERPFPDPYEAVMQKLVDRMVGTKMMLNAVLPSLAAAGLPVFTMKTLLPFPYVDSNIDVICIEPPTGKYDDFLHQADFRWRKNLADLREPKKRMFTKRQAPPHFPHFHRHTAVSWNGIDYLDLTAVWEARVSRQWNGIAVETPCATDELLILVAHALFENKYLMLYELLYLHYLLEEAIDWERVWRTTTQFGWQGGFRQVLAICAALGEAVGLPALALLGQMAGETAVSLRPNWHLPYMLSPQLTFGVSWQKLIADARQGDLRQLPRQLFSYSFVDGVWMYRKAWRKCRLHNIA